MLSLFPVLVFVNTSSTTDNFLIPLYSNLIVVSWLLLTHTIHSALNALHHAVAITVAGIAIATSMFFVA